MSTITIAGPGLVLSFTHLAARLSLTGVQRQGQPPLLFADAEGKQAGPGPMGNPLAVIVSEGKYAGTYGMDSFRVKEISHTERRLLAYLEHDRLPLLVCIEVEVEGHVATWRGQACWNGADAVDMDIYFPLLSRVRFTADGTDRAVLGRLSGEVREPLNRINVRAPYLGNCSSPVFLVEGGGRGLAVLDDNRADYAADPASSLQRSYVIGNTLPIPVKKAWFDQDPEGGTDGPLVGVCHTRRFSPLGDSNLAAYDRTAEEAFVALPMVCSGDAADLGPVRMYAYSGTWKAGAAWLRQQRKWVPFRVSPAGWFQRNTFIAEDMGDDMLRRGQSFHDYPKILAAKKQLGADFYHIPGFHDPEVLGTSQNWLNRGDYFFAAQNLGGFEAARQGIEAVHRAGGRIIYYVEGLIMWKRSRIGRSKGKAWALMKSDGSYDEHYRGFWHMCPACMDWCRWLAQECAQIVRTVGVDGFFIDSVCATHYHRCFNPAHGHPHPDVWNWGVRQLLRMVREEVDKVNPETVLFVEGVGDLAREFADGSLAHSHAWLRGRFSEPLGRFLHPGMRAYESWGSAATEDPHMQERSPERMHVWNSVNGYRIYSHNPDAGKMAELGRRTKAYYDTYPEICDSPMSELDVACENCLAQLFEGPPSVVTWGNQTGQPVEAGLSLPVPAGVLFDRVDGLRVPLAGAKASLLLQPWEFRAFEIRP